MAPYDDRSGSRLAQVMACCLTASSHYLNQCWFIMKCSVAFTWEFPQEIVMNLIPNMCSEIKLLKLPTHHRSGIKIIATSSRSQCVHSSWPGDAIWWHRFGSTLGQVMACCLTAPIHYQNQCWLMISSKVSCGIHPRAIPQEATMNLIPNICSELNFWNYCHISQGSMS